MFVPKSIVCLRDYSAAQFRADLGAGTVVGLVALPLAMAFAIASGLGPERGLYTAVVAGFLISALGGSRVQIGGPTGAFVVIVAGIVARYGYAGLSLATMMAGVILLVMGFARMGSIVKFISYPVTTGFTAGIAVVIFSTQVKDMLGLTMGPVPPEFLDKWAAYLQALPTANLYAAGITLATILCIALWPKAWQKVPGSVVALAAGSAAVWYFNLPVETIQSRFGGVPHGLPFPALPGWSWERARELFPSAMTVAILAAVESLLSAVVADGMISGRHKSNLELVAQGAANFASPLFGGMPATGAIARTATNVKNGGRTPVAGMVHALTLLVILLAGGKLAGLIPLACLAGVLAVVSYHMSEWRSFRLLLSSPRSDVTVLFITFLLTVFLDLTVAVEAGVIMSAFLFMKKMSDISQVKALTRDSGEQNDAATVEPLPRVAVPQGVEVFAIQGTLFFGAANKLLEVVRIMSRPPHTLILEMSGVLHMDATGLHVLEQIKHDCQHRGIRLMIAGIHAQPLVVLQNAGRFEAMGEGNFKASLEEALRDLPASGPAPEH